MSQKKTLLGIFTLCMMVFCQNAYSMSKPSKPCEEKPCKKKEEKKGCGCSSMNQEEVYDLAGRRRASKK